MHPIFQDLRYGVRSLTKAPSVAVIAVLALTLGTGAGTAIFSVVDAALWKPLPYRDPKGLVVMWEESAALGTGRMYVAAANLPAWLQNRSFEGMAAVLDLRINLTAGPNGHIEPEELRAERVSAGLFPLLGVQPSIGRAFRPDEDRPGHTDFVLLSHGLWQRRFGGDKRILGKSIRLREQSCEVLGVLPAGFSVLDPQTDVWLPLGMDPYDPHSATARMLTVVARLKRGVTLEQARSEMAEIGAQLERSNPALNTGWRPATYLFRDGLVSNSEKPLDVVLAAVGLLILMACANVANLLLARGAARQKEFALRMALGASRGRIVAQLLSESAILSLAGGAAGLVFARFLLAWLSRLGANSIPRIAEARFDVRLYVFAVALSLLSGLLFGAVPAIQGSGGGLRATLAEEGRGGTAARSSRLLRNLLVVSEMSLAVVVLIAAGLLVRSFARLSATDTGFQPASALTFGLPLGGGRNTAPERRAPFLGQVALRLTALPGARSMGAINVLPLTGFGPGSSFALEGQPQTLPGQRPIALLRIVTPGYFRTMGIPLVAGREFTDSDGPQTPLVAIVDQYLARRFSPGASPVGSRIAMDRPAPRTLEIVGVVGDVKPVSVNGESWPTVYWPYAQQPLTSISVVLRTARAPLSLAHEVEREIHQLDPDQPLTEVKSLDAVVGNSLGEARFHTLLLAAFAEVAFLLCAVGIYGVISYDTSQRTREIGIRMALGAQSGDVARLIVRQGARLAAYGIALGLAAAFALTRYMASMLYGIEPSDFTTFAAMAAMLGAVALLASYLPSRRAMALDPVAALRHE
ncbi:MAG TPA: ABC transporter permease [Bryobacteraceae bacterium]|nr:ABC transporter permease [Bryobacteraceae bacterium]